MKRLLLIALITTAALPVAEAAPRPVAVTRPMQTVTVTRQNVNEVVALPGNIVSAPVFTLTAETSGTVTSLLRARPGDPLAVNTALLQIGGTPVRLPVAGVFQRWLVAAQSTASAGMPLAEIAYAGFGQIVELPPQDAYRMLGGQPVGRASITGGPGPFGCPILQAPVTEPGQAKVVCAIPPDVKAFAGLTGMVAITSKQAEQVLVLPVTAVSGTVQSGEVSLVDGSVATVGLGVTDGNVVEITSGLTLGQLVLATAPPLEGLP